ncbi:MAG: hypothetical protein ACTSWY_00290 [Promethearchaeota archaeon]
MQKIPIIDDVGGFPLPEFTQRVMFDKLYWDAYGAIIKGFDVGQNRGLKTNVLRPIREGFKNKIESGLEVVNYPQYFDMCNQFLKPIGDYEIEPFLIEQSKARVIEIDILMNFMNDILKDYYEKTGNKLKLKICVTGPLELYQKKMGYAVYKDMALNLAKSINAFIQNSTNLIINNKYTDVPVVSIDEPSIGLVTLNGVTNDDISDILEASASGLKKEIDIQIHLHSLNAYQLALNTKNIDVITCEYAGNRRNVILKKDLEQYDKYIRVGVTRTNLDSIIAEEIDKGRDPRDFEINESLLSIIDGNERIKKRYKEAIKRYGDRLKYVGPDCGLKSWGNQIVAKSLLIRTVNTIKKLRDED